MNDTRQAAAGRERFDLDTDTPAATQGIAAQRTLVVHDQRATVDQQVDDLAGLMPDRDMLIRHRHDGAAQLPAPARLAADAMRASGDHDGGDDGHGQTYVPLDVGHAVTGSVCVCRPWKMTNSAGSTIRVNAAAEKRPPMITTASGRCTSEPMLWDSAIGISPSIASIVVISTVRRRTTDPSSAAWYALAPLRRS